MNSRKNTTEYPKKELSERAFSEFWHYQILEDRTMFTESGEPVSVLYPGRPNDIQGADFRDAVISTGDDLMKGNVEIHLRSGDWRNHHHHLDIRYNSVILHVVLQHNAKSGTVLQNGNEIPVLALGNYIAPETVPANNCINGIPCSGITGHVPLETILRILDTAGEARFFEKTSMLGKEIKLYGKGETIYRGLMQAMGYSGNKEPFLKLATLVQLKDIEKAGQGYSTNEEYISYIQAKLLGTAGFLEDTFRNNLTASGIASEKQKILQNLWHSFGNSRILSPEEWQLYRIRPCNSPFTRIITMSYLVAAYRHKGFLQNLIELADKIIDGKDQRIAEKELITATVSENEKPLLGKSRAQAITVNVLLPFFYAYLKTGQSQMLDIYRKYPDSTENSLERHMRMQLGLEKMQCKTAIRQQGLIHIYQQFCTQGRCNDCELGKL